MKRFYKLLKPIPGFEDYWKVGEVKDNYCESIFFNRFYSINMAQLAILIINGYVEEMEKLEA